MKRSRRAWRPSRRQKPDPSSRASRPDGPHLERSSALRRAATARDGGRAEDVGVREGPTSTPSACSRWPSSRARSSRSGPSSRPPSAPGPATALRPRPAAGRARPSRSGLILVIVGGAELFTGNNLIVMAWASRKVSDRGRAPELGRSCTSATSSGPLATAVVMFVSGQYSIRRRRVGSAALTIGNTKAGLELRARRSSSASCATPWSAWPCG